MCATRVVISVVSASFAETKALPHTYVHPSSRSCSLAPVLSRRSAFSRSVYDHVVSTRLLPLERSEMLTHVLQRQRIISSVPTPHENKSTPDPYLLIASNWDVGGKMMVLDLTSGEVKLLINDGTTVPAVPPSSALPLPLPTLPHSPSPPSNTPEHRGDGTKNCVYAGDG